MAHGCLIIEGSNGWVGARMLTIRTLRRVSRVLPLTRGLTDTPSAITIFVVFGFSIGIAVVHDTVHAIFALAVNHVFVDAET